MVQWWLGWLPKAPTRNFVVILNLLEASLELRVYKLQVMQGIQKLKCTSCGVTFMSETEVTTCPSCSESKSHGHENTSGCGCGHSH
jgi:Zn finger protein HypA/HybF involved in hydrogenase expression